MAAKRKLVKLAKGVSTFSMMLFNDKRPTSIPQECPVVRESADILAKVLLPAVNDILNRMEYTEQAVKAQQKFDDYRVTASSNVDMFGEFTERVAVAPSQGMILATDTMFSSGPSWESWKFMQVTNITSKGIVMVKDMKKATLVRQLDGSEGTPGQECERFLFARRLAFQWAGWGSGTFATLRICRRVLIYLTLNPFSSTPS